MALLSYEDAMCGGCGQPKDVAYNPDADGWFEAHEVVCAGCAAQQNHTGRQQKPPPGQKVFVVDGRPAELELKPWQLIPSGAGADQDDGGDPT